MFSNSRQFKETKAALIAALDERDEYLRQRDIAVSERNAAVRERADAIVGKLDRLPAAFQLALAERTAYHEQRDQAFRELDTVTSERNQLKGRDRAAQAPDRHPSIVSDALCALNWLDVARRRFKLKCPRRDTPIQGTAAKSRIGMILRDSADARLAHPLH